MLPAMLTGVRNGIALAAVEHLFPAHACLDWVTVGYAWNIALHFTAMLSMQYECACTM